MNQRYPVLPRRKFLAASAALPLAFLARGGFIDAGAAGEAFSLPRCRLLPLPDHQTAFQLGDRESARWHFGPQYPRPFFFPFNGPSGISLTRMGHPGAPNHDHHRSIWFAHHDVDGISFWTESSPARIRQKEWLCYVDGENECTMAVRLGWFANGHERELLEQTLIAIARPLDGGEHTLELQSTFRAVAQPVRLGQTNFGFLAVRVAKSISEFFGGGRLTDSEGRQTEAAIFGRQAQWMDYSGPVATGATEGLTYFDHPSNPGHPAHWHVREDGWMGASFSMTEARVIAPDAPLRLRYLLHAHRGSLDSKKAETVLNAFRLSPCWDVRPSKAKHRQHEIVRLGDGN